MINIFKNYFLAVIILVLSFFVMSNILLANSPDAIAIRVMPNSKHISALEWYKVQNFSGSPQTLLIDGYRAVRDGRTAYVNVANAVDTGGSADPDIIFTNIYIISFNQKAESDTIDIFGKVLNHWKFNSNLTSSGNCRNNPSKNCNIDSDCESGGFCDSLKARIIRDTRRAEDIAEVKDKLSSFYSNTGFYPKLSAGTYLPRKTLSVWPSWQENLSGVLRAKLPKDPVNKIGECISFPGYSADTCWSSSEKKFVSPTWTWPNLPTNSLLYMYYSNFDGSSYDLCATFEAGIPLDSNPNTANCHSVCLDIDQDGYGQVPACGTPIDCRDAIFSIHPNATEICGDFIDQDCINGDLACPKGCSDNDGDNFDSCDPSDPNDTDGKEKDCNDSLNIVHPGAIEQCDDRDNNCDGNVDEICDVDNDGFCSCQPSYELSPSSLATCSGTDRTSLQTIANTCDCNDTPPSGFAIHPGVEICDGVDNNCSLGIDEGCDDDFDGYCDDSMTVVNSPPAPHPIPICPFTDNSSDLAKLATLDCDDGSLPVHPNISESSVSCSNGIDDDCDLLTDCSDLDCSADPACSILCTPAADPPNSTLCPGGGTGLTSPASKSVVDFCNPTNKCEYICSSGYTNVAGVCTSAPQCTGQDPANAIMCPGDNSGLTVDTPKTLINGSCVSNTTKCEFECSPGYIESGGACVPPPQCTGLDPANATMCPGDNSGLTVDTPKTLINGSCVSNTTKCEFECSPGYIESGGSCVPPPQCTGLDPANATMCPGDDIGLSTNQNKILINGSCIPGNSVKCEFECSPGYIESGGACVPPPQCTGQDPANATICPGDNSGLTVDTPKTLINGSCVSNTTKCEFECNPGYIESGGSCVAFMCVGVTPGNSSLCPLDSSSLTGDTPVKPVSSCTDPVKCEYLCDPGYVPNGNDCVASCSFTFTPPCILFP